MRGTVRLADGLPINGDASGAAPATRVRVLQKLLTVLSTPMNLDADTGTETPGAVMIKRMDRRVRFRARAPALAKITLALHYQNMQRQNAPFEIHVHGQVPLRPDVNFDQIQDALKPLWKYAGARSLTDGATSAYEDEPGIKFDAQEHVLQLCWTVAGDEDFRQSLDEMCMSLNELSETGATIEVTFYDTDFDEDDEDDDEAESRDDFMMLFVGPNPAAIMQVQRDLLVQDMIGLLERHFEGAELGGVVAEVDKLFAQRFDALVNSLEIGRPPRGSGGSGGPGSGHGGQGHGGGRKPRHLH